MIKKQFITNDILVYWTDNDTLLGVDIYSFRSEKWRVDLQSEDVQLIDVVAVNNRIYVVTVQKDYAVSLLNVYNGTFEWTLTVNGSIEPNSLTGTDNWLLLTSRKNYRSAIQVVDGHNGRLMWDFVMGGHGEGFDPVVDHQRVYVGGADREERFRRDDKDIYPIRLYCLDTVSGDVLWQSHEWYSYVSGDQREKLLLSNNSTEPEGREGILCVDTDNGIQHILNRATGELLWMYDTNTLTVIRY